MSQRLTRKEIKHDIREDEVRGMLLRIFDVVQQRPNLIVGGVVGIIALILVLTGLFAYFDSRAEKANEELAAAIKVAAARVGEEAPADDSDEPSFATEEERRGGAKEAFEKVRDGLGASVAGDIANLYLADIAIEEGDTVAAREIWEAFLRDHDEHVLALSVRVNLIHLDRQDGRAQEVADKLQSELDSAVKTLPEDVILFELAQTLETLEQQDAALEAYQRILDDHPKSPYSAKARQMTTSAG